MNALGYLIMVLFVSASYCGTYWLGDSNGYNRRNDKAKIEKGERDAIALNARNDHDRELSALADRYAAEKMQLKKENHDAHTKNDAANAVLRADIAANGLRLSSTICAQFTGAGKTAGASGSDASIAGTVALPDALAGALSAAALNADTIVENCRTLQDFITAQGMAP